MSVTTETQSNPTIKGRFLNLQVHKLITQKLAKKMKAKLTDNDKKIKQFLLKNQQATQSTIIADRITHIKDLFTQRLQQIDYKINKHLIEQKQKNQQMLQLIGIIKNQKNNLQNLLQELQERIYTIQLKIGQQDSHF